jgi:EAL domain-containing protein (putative c-di-GMP-specific phosphodiesterase class I)/GGDEF domain-containing protein
LPFDGGRVELGPHLHYLEEIGPRHQIDQMIDGESEQGDRQWSRTTAVVPNFGYSESAYWLRVDVRNASASTADLFLVYEYPLIDELEVYFVRDRVVQASWSTGDTFGHHTRAVENRNFLFPLVLTPNQEVSIWLRVRSQGAVQIPLYLQPQAEFFKSDQSELSLKTLYYGMMLVMVVYNLFLYFSVREVAYLYYVGFVASFVLMLAAMHGVLFLDFYPEMPRLHQQSVLVLVPLTTAFSCLFLTSFLNLKRYASFLNRAINTLAVLAVFSVVASFVLSYGQSTRFSVLLVAVSSILMMISGPVALRNGQSSARYFIAAWAFLLLGAVSASLAKFGLVPTNGFTENALMYGSAVEAVLLSFALADRLNREREARFAAQQNELKEARQRQEAEEKLFHQSTHDPLTGMPNAVLLHDRLAQLLAQGEYARLSLVTIRLGQFDEIARTLGKINLDQLVRAFGVNLEQVLQDRPAVLPVSEHYACARLGANTFGFIQTLAVDEKVADSLASLQTRLAIPVRLLDMHLDCGVRIGVACCPEHAREPEELIKQSSIAAEIGGQPVALYDPEQNPYSQRRLALIGDLRLAIAQDQLMLNFQPQLDLQSGHVTGLEALARWSHPVFGFVPPSEFVALAEQTGLIRELTYWVLDHALAAQASLSKAGYNLELSVNLSAVNLHEVHLLDNIGKLLSRHGVQPSKLTLEVTETAMMLNPEKSLMVLNRISDTGVRIALDDFGTGHCSLGYIKKLPAHEIKIDRSFIMDMINDPDDELIVATTIGMCHNLGYRVVAEGIEDKPTQSRLLQLNCDLGQGYHFCKPLAFGDLELWLRKRQHSAA